MDRRTDPAKNPEVGRIQALLWFVLAAGLALLGCGATASEPAGPTAPKGPVAPQVPTSPTTPLPPAAPALGDCRVELQEKGSWTERGRFACPVVGPLELLLVGDVGAPGPILDASVDGMIRYCSSRSCALLLVAGDLLYGPGTQAEATWRAVWDDALARVGVPTVAVLGNHEYRHEPNPELKRRAVYAADGRAGLILPGPSYALRVTRDGKPVLAIAAMDTDSIANPGPEMPGGAEAAVAAACSVGVPVVALGHHPASSQGGHHSHEAHVERSLRDLLIRGAPEGCVVSAAVAGHDHDLQAYPPGCEEQGMPAVVVSGVVARGSRGRGSTHLDPCPVTGQASSYHAGPRAAGGFAVLRVDSSAAASVTLFDVPSMGRTVPLSTLNW